MPPRRATVGPAQPHLIAAIKVDSTDLAANRQRRFYY